MHVYARAPSRVWHEHRYSLTTVVVPILVSTLTVVDHDGSSTSATFYLAGMTQMWMESGGVVANAALLMVANSLSTDGARVLQVVPLVSRHVLARFARRSQMRLNQLWAPPSMELGTMHAETFRMLALGLVYAPVYPIAFLITSYTLFQAFYANKYATLAVMPPSSLPRAFLVPSL